MKNETIKSFLVVTLVLVFCGVLLTVLSNLLKVSDSEKILTTVNEIYGENNYTATTENINSNFSADYGTIDAVYKISNGDYLILSTGKGGYKNGTVTFYTCFTIQNNDIFVYKTLYESSKNQTFINVIEDITSTYTNKEVFDAILLDNNYSGNCLISGATPSMSHLASNNAVRVAGNYLKFTLGV